MTKVVEAIYEDGVLKPVHPRDLAELLDHQAVTLTIQTREQPDPAQRAAALAELERGIEEMSFRSTGPYPTRDELHERR
jgi:predicted DNA-binding antitoxin AbrB/MazE fold protein